MTIVTTVRKLEAPYGEPIGRSLTKEIDHISDHYRGFIEHAPFVVVATSGPGFVRVQDANTVLLPDRRGNNRLDTLKNIVRDPRISLLRRTHEEIHLLRNSFVRVRRHLPISPDLPATA